MEFYAGEYALLVEGSAFEEVKPEWENDESPSVGAVRFGRSFSGGWGGPLE